MSLSVAQRRAAFVGLGDYIRAKPELLDAYVQRTAHRNGWFTPENQWRMLDAIAADYLSEGALDEWLANYDVPDSVAGTTVGIVMAGNIPLVGFHDWLCVLIAGAKAQVKLSEKDLFMLPHLAQQLQKIESGFTGRTQFVDRLKDFDAVIATGSNNTARYFEQYFGKYPHIIRRNRTSVAVLHGDESTEDLSRLAEDVFAYFGMGCRSVGKLYAPGGYDFDPLLAALHEHKAVALNSKWKNNFDYNYALYIINKNPFLATGSVLLREDKELHSRLGTLHYEYYNDTADLAIDLHSVMKELQVTVSVRDIPGVSTKLPGEAQRPALDDYADDVDTLGFLIAQNALIQKPASPMDVNPSGSL